MEEKVITEKENESSALEKLNKVITGICAFLAVLVLNDIRTSVKDLKDEVKAYVASYNNLEKRVSILEYSFQNIKATTYIPASKDTFLFNGEQTYFTKPEEITIKKKKV